MIHLLLFLFSAEGLGDFFKGIGDGIKKVFTGDDDDDDDKPKKPKPSTNANGLTNPNPTNYNKLLQQQRDSFKKSIQSLPKDLQKQYLKQYDSVAKRPNYNQTISAPYGVYSAYGRYGVPYGMNYNYSPYAMNYQNVYYPYYYNNAFYRNY